MNEAERANVKHIAKWDTTSWDNFYNWDGDITIKGDFIKSENGDGEMVDVSKAILSGDWELIERNGLIYLTKHGYGIEIALSPQDAQEVWRMLDAYMEWRAYEWAASYGSSEEE